MNSSWNLNSIFLITKLKESLKFDLERFILEEYGEKNFDEKTKLLDDLQKNVSRNFGWKNKLIPMNWHEIGSAQSIFFAQTLIPIYKVYRKAPFLKTPDKSGKKALSQDYGPPRKWFTNLKKIQTTTSCI